MCSVGDMKNNLRILQSKAHQMKYNKEFDIDGLTKGNPHALLPLYNHIFTAYNPQFSTEVLELLDDNLYMKSDVRFMEAVYKVLRDMFHFKPSITKEQFFTVNNFAERKIIMCVEVMTQVQQHCRFFGPKNPTNPNIRVTSVVDTRRCTKKPSTELVTAEPSAESGLPRKVSEKGRLKTQAPLMGISDSGWQLKVGYLQQDASGVRPKENPGEKGSKEGAEKEKSAVGAKVVREFSPDRPKDKPAEAVQMLRDKAEKAQVKVADIMPKASNPQHSDWDPTGAVESILAKVRDLPIQLTNFMKAVEGRLQKIEGRLECVEGTVANLAVSKSQQDLPRQLKNDLDTMQSRLLLLENRATLMENKTTTSRITEESRNVPMVEEKRDFTPGPFVSLERGEDLFSGSLVSTFSPIRQDISGFHPNNSDTLASLADEDRRLSSTPNQSLTTRPPLHNNTTTNNNNSSSSRQDEEKRAGVATANSTLVWDDLDFSTQQQVERIKDMLKATQVLLPNTVSQQQVDT